MIMLFSLFLSLSFASFSDTKQYPEERDYTSGDRGFRQYGAPSIHNTSTYALTFDDGPHPTHTPKLLDLLKAYDVKATFFIITSRLDRTTRPMVKRMLAEGHIVAVHGVDHHNSNQLPEAEYKKNVKDAFVALNAIYEEVGIPFSSIYYRYPYAAYGTRSDYHHMNALKAVSRDLFGDNCIQFAFWDVDTVDWLEGMTPQDVFQNLVAHEEGGLYWDFEIVRDAQGRTSYRKVQKTITNPTRGGVILQHDIQQRTLEGTRLFLEYAKNNGIKLTTLPEIEEFRILRECRFLN